MIALLLFIVFGLVFGYFSTLNTSPVEINLGVMTLQNIPMYILIILAIALGVIFASIFYFVKFISVQMSVRKIERELSESKQSAAELLKKIHQLELDKTKILATNGHREEDEESI